MNAMPFTLSIGTFTMDSPLDAFMMGPFNPLASILGHSMIMHEQNHLQARSVGPVITTEFPDTVKPTLLKRKRVTRKTAKEDLTCECSICLEPVVVSCRSDIKLPCGHVFHRICVFAILTTSTLGSDSMMRCPLCRYKLDRHDLEGGFFLTVVRKMSHCGASESRFHPVI